MERVFFIQLISFFTPYNRISECDMDISNYTLNQIISTYKRCAQGSKGKTKTKTKKQKEKEQSRRWELAGQKSTYIVGEKPWRSSSRICSC